MNDVDPPRLWDPRSGASDDLRAALGEARRAVPSAARLAKISAGLPAATAVAGVGGAASLGSLATSVIAGSVIGVAVLAGGALGWRSHAPVTPTPSVARVATPASSEPSASAARPREDLAPRVASTASVTEPAPTSVTDTPSPRVVVAPSAGRVAAPRDEIAPAEEGETEIHLLQRAQTALAADPSLALRLADAHARRFPRGALGQEREIVAVEALFKLGRADQARARGERFLAAHPESAHRRRLEVLMDRVPDRSGDRSSDRSGAP